MSDKREVYLDNAATTMQYPQVTEYMARLMRESYGNPSSLHRLGLGAEKILKESRKSLAAFLGAEADQLYFTSGGTEADNTALFSTAFTRKARGKKIILSKVEHPAVLEPGKRLEEMGFKVEYIGVDSKGVVDVEQLEAALDRETLLISLMAVNNETGAIMPLEKIAALKDAFNKREGCDIILHSDGVQALGKIALNLKGSLSGVDMMSFSGHKVHGPKGIGMLYMKKNLNLKPFMAGGGQEKGFRSGTENVPAIGGLALAGELGLTDFAEKQEKLAGLKTYLSEGIKSLIKDIRINGPEGERASAGVLNVSFLGTRGEVILHSLEQEGIYVSTGSACSSNKKSKGSHVLQAMGLKPKEIEGAIRFSFGSFNTPEEMDYTLDRLEKAVSRFRKLGTFR